MTISQHAERTEKLVGVRAEDIHKWIDGMFDVDGFQQFLRSGGAFGKNPYDHRKYRHCQEALEEAMREFRGRYSPEQIRRVFECHVRDDYDGYLPKREDFENGMFTERYHHEGDGAGTEAILDHQERLEYFDGKSYPQYHKVHGNLSRGFLIRIVLPAVVAIILFISSISIIIVPVFERNMMNDKKEMIRELTRTAASALDYYIDLERKGILSRAEAQKEAAEEVRKMRYGIQNKDYFWITDMTPRMIMHPYRPDLIGKDLTDYRDREDKSGKKLFVEFVKLVRENNEGYLRYMWQWMDDPTRTAPKLSYVRGVPEWGWIIGTGIYIDDVQKQMAHLRNRLLLVFGSVSLVVALILVNVIIQSRNIEQKRLRAEIGLIEAKERYRALVEASREGYILELGGRIIYSNLALRKMLGYSEEELASMKLTDLLDPESPTNATVMDHFEKLARDEAQASEFEARVKTKSGKIIEMIIATSKMFFPQTSGHIVSFREITPRKMDQAIVPFVYRTSDDTIMPDEIITDLSRCETIGQIIHLVNQLHPVVREMASHGASPATLRATIASIYDATVESVIKIAIQEHGDSPVPFAFLSLGSSGRREMTMFSDQDNALVYSDMGGKGEKVKDYFLRLSHDICSKLNQAGFPYCEGGVMASNPQWCLSITGWEKQISDWVLGADSESIIKLQVLLDNRHSYGDETLTNRLRLHILEISRGRREFFMHFAQNCLSIRPPLNLFGHIRTERRDGARVINIKRTLKPVETFARIYALHNQIIESGTIQRLEHLLDKGILKDPTYREIVYVFDYLWGLRFNNQLLLHFDLRKVDDDLNLEELTDIEREILQSVLSRISTLQSRLSYDFLGTSLG